MHYYCRTRRSWTRLDEWNVYVEMLVVYMADMVPGRRIEPKHTRNSLTECQMICIACYVKQEEIENSTLNALAQL